MVNYFSNNSIWFALIIIIIFYIVLYIVSHQLSNKIKENFDLGIDNSRVYPGTLAYKPGFGPYRRPYTGLPWPNNMGGYDARLTDYYYIPAQDNMNSWMNGGRNRYVESNIFEPKPTQCIIPPLTSKKCVNEHLQQTGNLDMAIYECTVPKTLSDGCSRSWPTNYSYQNDPTNINVFIN